MPYSERLKSILGEGGGILAGVSGQKAAIRVSSSGGELSSATILKMKNGVYGEDASLRTLARAYTPELLAAHRSEITTTFEMADENALTAEDWKRIAADWLVLAANSDDGVGALLRPRSWSDADVARIAEEAASRALKAAGYDGGQDPPSDTYDLAYAREMRRVREKLKAEGILKLPEELGHQGGTRQLTAEDAIAEARDFEQMVRELIAQGSG